MTEEDPAHLVKGAESYRQTIKLRGRHEARRIRFAGLHQLGDWEVKLYQITIHSGDVPPELRRAALTTAADALPNPARTQDRYGIGFVTVHEAADFCFVLVDWWSGENEIHQRMFSAPLDDPTGLRPHPTDAVGCIWELSVTDFERRYWIQDVLANPSGPDLNLYLTRSFNGDV